MFAKDELRYVALTVWIVAVVEIRLPLVTREKLPVELLIKLHTMAEAFTLTGEKIVVVNTIMLAVSAERFCTEILSTDMFVVVYTN